MKRGEAIDSFTITDTGHDGGQHQYTYTLYSNGKVYQGRYLITSPDANTAGWEGFKRRTISETTT